MLCASFVVQSSTVCKLCSTIVLGRDLVLAWQEMVQPNQEIRTYVVRPDPYRGYLHRVVHADVIFSQGHWTHRLAGLAAAVDLAQWCSQPDNRCASTHAWTLIPYTLAPVHDVQAGDPCAVTLPNTPPLMTPPATTTVRGEGQQREAAQQAGESDRHLGPHDPPPDDHDFPEPMGGDDDESSLHSGDLRLLIYRLAAPDLHCFAPGATYMSTLHGIIRASGLPEVRCFHYLSSQLERIQNQKRLSSCRPFTTLRQGPMMSNDQLHPGWYGNPLSSTTKWNAGAYSSQPQSCEDPSTSSSRTKISCSLDFMSIANWNVMHALSTKITTFCPHKIVAFTTLSMAPMCGSRFHHQMVRTLTQRLLSAWHATWQKMFAVPQWHCPSFPVARVEMNMDGGSKPTPLKSKYLQSIAMLQTILPHGGFTIIAMPYLMHKHGSCLQRFEMLILLSARKRGELCTWLHGTCITHRAHVAMKGSRCDWLMNKTFGLMSYLNLGATLLTLINLFRFVWSSLTRNAVAWNVFKLMSSSNKVSTLTQHPFWVASKTSLEMLLRPCCGNIEPTQPRICRTCTESCAWLSFKRDVRQRVFSFCHLIYL